MSEVKDVPELRFYEFLDAWSLLKVSDVARVYDGTHQTPKYVEQGVPFYSVEHVTANQFSETKYISEEVYEKENQRVRLEKSDILMTRIGSIGKAKYIDWDVRASFYVSLALFKVFDSFDSKFLSQLISSPDFQRELWKRTIHVAFPQKINLGEISHCKIVIPGLKEQQKIADFLSSVDKKIEQLTEKHRLLTEYKKGVMQQIFTQQIRFKDNQGNEYPEWEKKKLGELSDVRDGTHESPKFFDRGYPLITSKNLLRNGKLDLENISFISENDYEQINKRSKVDDGDILFGMIGTIGNPVKVNSSQFAIKNVALIKQKNMLINDFLIHYLKSNLIEKQFHQQNTGGTQKFIALGVIRNLLVLTPCLHEQQKIANFLTEIDQKIDQAWSILEQTKAFKKGLLQKMFV